MHAVRKEPRWHLYFFALISLLSVGMHDDAGAFAGFTTFVIGGVIGPWFDHG